jgi:oxygen-dependent protoporphyrinogen oxidase
VSRRVVVVGGGVGGLAAAYRLLRADPSLDVAVLEADDRPGGKLRTVSVGGLEVEAGPDAFVARKPWAADLCRELGVPLEAPATSRSLVWTDRGLLPFPGNAFGVPASPAELLRWPGLPLAARVRALRDLWARGAGPEGDEPLGRLVRRRLGDGVAEVLVEPLLAGLFAGDADRLSVRATFPELAAWERDHGSLIRGARAALRAARRVEPGPVFVRPVGGVRRLVDALVGALGPGRIRVGAVARAVHAEGRGYLVDAGADGTFPADAVVLATPAFVAADLLEGLAPGAAAGLRRIPYLSTGVLALAYPEGTGERLPEASGFVVPRGRAAMLACTFLSRKWPDASFGSRAVLRCFLGGAGAEDLLEVPGEEIVEGVGRQLAAVLDLPPLPEAWALVRWPRAMPQYEVGHGELVRGVAGALPPGIFLVGAAYGGAGVADVVRTADEAAVGALAHAGGAERVSGRSEEPWTTS